MAEFKPFDLNYRILASIPNDRPNVVLSAQTYLKLKNALTPAQTNEKEEKSNSGSIKSEPKRY